MKTKQKNVLYCKIIKRELVLTCRIDWCLPFFQPIIDRRCNGVMWLVSVESGETITGVRYYWGTILIWTKRKQLIQTWIFALVVVAWQLLQLKSIATGGLCEKNGISTIYLHDLMRSIKEQTFTCGSNNSCGNMLIAIDCWFTNKGHTMNWLQN